MTQQRPTLGQAIDQVIGALEQLEADARATVVATACAHLKISIQPNLQPAARSDGLTEQHSTKGGRPAPVETPTAAPVQSAKDVRSFRNEKQPRSAREMACVVAFYLKELAPEGERKDSISTPDLEKYFKQAQFKLPQRIAQLLPDAKGSGYFDSASRGDYKLNAVGYNLVAHSLPPKSDKS